MKFQAVRGFKDWSPEDFKVYHFLIQLAREILLLYGFQEVKTPILEKTELFVRSIGEVTDIVQKETYTFQDRNGESLTLRPEVTAGICRMVIEKALHTKYSPLRLFTIGPMFRHERPQKGRLREFHQIDVEYLGDINPYVEAELIILAWHILTEPEKRHHSFEHPLRLEINSLGCRSCRPSYREYLVSQLKKRVEGLCPTCQGRLERNPLRVLDCKEERCQTLIRSLRDISEFWCEGCNIHFQELTSLLSELHLAYQHNPYLVRGLDYYVRTIFEIKADWGSSQDTVCAGGRFDYLVEELGGPKLPGLGFAIGLERWALALWGEKRVFPLEHGKIYLAALGKRANVEALKLAQYLRKNGISTLVCYSERSLKAKLKSADKFKARFALILGEEELKKGEIILRDMKRSMQEILSLQAKEDMVKRLKEALAKS